MTQHWSRHGCSEDSMAPGRHIREADPWCVDLTFRTAIGELVKSGRQLYVEGCDDRGVNLSSRCPSACVPTTVVCWRVHDDGWSCSLVR